MPLIIPDFSPPDPYRDHPGIAMVERIVPKLVERLEGEWDVVDPEDKLDICRDLLRIALREMHLKSSDVTLACVAERNAPKGGIMLPGAETVTLWNGMLDAILVD